MINEPILVNQQSFQQAWTEAALILRNGSWAIRNLVVHIADSSAFDNNFHQVFAGFCALNSILGPKHVAYTIFPHNLYRTRCSADRLFLAYNRTRGLYERLRTRPRSSWGTYFRRMTHYETTGGTQNQLENIVQKINARSRIHKASYTIVIQKPGSETVRPRSGPCLNYLAAQLEPDSPRPLLGLLAVYRNHDFLERAYGNYWGLCKLIGFLARETNSSPGPLTCVSSRAYIDKNRGSLTTFLDSL